MDFIFECFYEDTLDKITRNGLQDRSSRRDVLDHLNAIIGGCSDGQNMHTEEVARIAVLSAVRYHRDKKEANGDVCLMGKFHNILYIALRTCWDWGVRDSAVVVVLLEEIYACEKTFERIFLGALFGPNAPHFIAGWRSDFRDQDENTRAMVYFLHHATGLNMTLPVWIARYEQERMIKFIDIPIESCGRSSPLRVALQASAPDLLLILLRYGADPNPPDGGTSVVLSLLDKLIENGRNYVFQHISCLQILLRNIPKIELPYKPIIYSTRRTMFFERYGRLLIDRIISNDQVYGVMSLRHLCRCRIRDLLRSNGQLPDGIDTLRLPRRLQRYIDLMEEIEGPKDDNDMKNNEKPTTSKKAKQVRIVVDDCDVKKDKPSTSKALTEKSSCKSKDTSGNTSTSAPTTDEKSTNSDKNAATNSSSSSSDSCSTTSAPAVDMATSSSEKDIATSISSSSAIAATLVDSFETITVIDCAPTDSDTISATNTTPTATITMPVASAVNAIPDPHTSTVVLIDKPFPTEIVVTGADADAAVTSTDTATDAMPGGPSTEAAFVVAVNVIDKPISIVGAVAAAAAPTGDDASASTSDTSVSTSDAASTVVIIDKPFSL